MNSLKETEDNQQNDKKLGQNDNRKTKTGLFETFIFLVVVVKDHLAISNIVFPTNHLAFMFKNPISIFGEKE